MSANANAFPAKILLFGEYTILLGSTALSIPFDLFSAELKMPGNEDTTSSTKQASSNNHLFTFYHYLSRQENDLADILDFETFRSDLAEGLYLQSSIPAGYGLGSSGALVAGIFDRFAKRKLPLDETAGEVELVRLKKVFSVMESYFHGTSSGFDPMVSFLRRPLLLRQDGIPGEITLPKDFSASGAGIFVLDTGQTSKTAPLVKLFLEKFKKEDKITDKGSILLNLINELVTAFLDFSDRVFWDSMKRLSSIQSEEFISMIPASFLPIWSEGIERGLFYLKLCGSGGGGYLTGFAPDLLKAISFLQERNHRPLAVPVQ